MSSYDCGRAAPPVTTILIWRRTASSHAMLSALVTTVTAGDLGRATGIGPGRERARDLGRGGAAVEADDRADGHERRRRLADALLLGRVTGRLVAQGQVIVDVVDDRPATRPGQQLLMGQLVEVAPDGGVRHVQVAAERLHVHVAALP